MGPRWYSLKRPSLVLFQAPNDNYFRIGDNQLLFFYQIEIVNWHKREQHPVLGFVVWVSFLRSVWHRLSLATLESRDL
jgi:hypothetical protein